MRRMLAMLLALSVPLPIFAAEPTAAEIEFFEKQVRPLLIDHCVRCHGDKKAQAGLRLDTAEGTRKGTDDGPVIVAGKPDESKLIKSVRRIGDYAMPPDDKLSKEQVAILEAWVTMGAPFPAAAQKPAAKAFESHWAFQPMRDPAIPKSTEANPIDAFIGAKLAEKKLDFGAPATRRTLARRVAIDLTGLPLSADELDAFEKDPDPLAYEKLVDRLLAMPQYGERWGRYWLDIARYADTKGYVFTEDRNYPFAYTFRDYIIRSLNEDKPFDRFILEQLAADKLGGSDKKSLAAMGFLTVGRRFSNDIHDITDDRIDVVTRGFLGLTVGCARCHDHKYDPIAIGDYYALYGVFASSEEPKDLPSIGEGPATERYSTELAKLEKAVADERERINTARRTSFGALLGGPAARAPVEKLRPNQGEREALQRVRNAIEQFKLKSPDTPPHAMVMVDRPNPVEPRVFLRGNPGNQGPAVPRQLPAVVTGKDRKPFADGSGRLEMARQIASKSNPLTARVIVNRVWQWHFGQGFVRTPSDFGLRSDPPTHPELLDWLALRFIDDGWSIKKLHRRIMLSRTYRQASATESAAVDPEHRWLSGFPRQRLDFEAMRDGILAASGQLDRTQFGRSVELFKAPFSKRRAVYGFVDRQNLPGTFRAFDFASPEQHTSQRFLTTVPQQALFLLNSPFVAEATLATLKRPEFNGASDPVKKLDLVYRAILSRSPTTAERDLATKFIASVEAAKPGKKELGAWEQFVQVLLLSNEFAYVD